MKHTKRSMVLLLALAVVTLVGIALVVIKVNGKAKNRNNVAESRNDLPAYAVGSYTMRIDMCVFIRLDIKQDSEFTYVTRTDTGSSFFASGTVAYFGDRIDLIAKQLEQNDEDLIILGKKPNSHNIFSFVPIRWDQRLYLVPEDRLLLFCNQVNLGSEPQPKQADLFFFRDQDKAAVLSKSPDLPPQMKKYIITNSLKGSVVAIEGDRGKINLGEKDNVFKYMLLYCEPDEASQKTIKADKGNIARHCILIKITDVHNTFSYFEAYKHQVYNDIQNIDTGYVVYSKFPESVRKNSIDINFTYE